MSATMTVIFFILLVIFSIVFLLDVKKELREIEEENKKWAMKLLEGEKYEDKR